MGTRYARLVTLSLLSLAAVLAGCALPGASTGNIPICIVGDFSGPLASYGTNLIQGAEIAAEEINAAGGVDGKQIELKQFNEQTDPVEAVQIAQQVGDECVAAIVGSGSGPALAAGPYYEEAGVPFILTTSSNPAATESGWRFVSRIQLSDYDQVERLIDYAATELGIERVALLHDTTDLGTGGVASAQEIVAGRNDIELVATEAWKLEDVDFSAQILNAQEAGADAIYIIGAAEGAARITQQAQDLGVDLQLLANTSVGNQQFLNLAGASAEGMVITWGAVDPNNPIVASIAETMREEYDREIDVFVAQAHDAVQVLADAMEEAGTTTADREAIQQAIRGGTFEYAVGPLSFDETGHNIRHIYVARVENGAFQIID